MKWSKVPRVLRLPLVAILSFMFGIALTVRCTYLVCKDFMDNVNNGKPIGDYYSEEGCGR